MLKDSLIFFIINLVFSIGLYFIIFGVGIKNIKLNLVRFYLFRTSYLLWQIGNIVY